MRASVRSFIKGKMHVAITEVQRPGEIAVVKMTGEHNFTVLTNPIAIAGDMTITLPWPIDAFVQGGKILFTADRYYEIVDVELGFLFSTLQPMQAGVGKELSASVQRIAACTMCYNEDYIIKKWAEYYGTILGYENLYIIDDGSDVPVAEVLAGLPVNITRVPRTTFDTWRLVRSIGSLQRLLLETYDVVLSMDSDEFLVLNAENPGLDYPDFAAYLRSIPPEHLVNVAPVGFNVIHSRSREADLDCSRPIMQQRKYVSRSHLFDKPLISAVPTSFAQGLHNAYFPKRVDPNLILLHFRFFDYNFAISKLTRYQNTAWSAYDLEKGLSAHQRVKVEECDALFRAYDEQVSLAKLDGNIMELQDEQYGVLSDSFLAAISTI